MAAASDIVLMYVVPALGAFFLLMLFLSPLQTILEVNRRKALEVGAGGRSKRPARMLARWCLPGWCSAATCWLQNTPHRASCPP